MLFLKDGLGLDIEYKAWDKENQLPFFLRSAYDIKFAIIEHCPCVLLFPKENLANISALKKHIIQVQKIEQLPVVLVMSQITEFRRKTLLENKLPFIIDGKMCYLPFVGTYMVPGEKAEKVALEKYRPSTQIAFFYYLYAKKKEMPLVELADKLPFTVMSVNRAKKQLEESKLFQSYKDGVRIILRGNDKGQKLFENAKALLKSPVRYKGYMNSSLLNDDFLLSGLSALAEYTMLNPESVRTYAVKSSAIKKVDLCQELVDETRQVRVELWQYDPKILGKNGIVDPLSLAIVLQDVVDERVEQSIDEMLREVWEN